jgi:WD40 repeat protein
MLVDHFTEACRQRVETRQSTTRTSKTYNNCRGTIQCKDAVLCVLPIENTIVATSHATFGQIQTWDINHLEHINSFGRVEMRMSGWEFQYPPTDEMSWLWDMTLLRNDRLICSSYEVGAMRVFNHRTGQVLNTIRHEEPISGLGHTNILAFGDYVMTGLEDRTITVWNIVTGKVERVMEGHEGWVYCLETLPVGKLVSGGGDNTIRVWNMETNSCDTVIENTGHGGVVSLQYMDQIQTLVSGGTDDTIKLWDINTGTCTSTLRGHEHRVKQVKMVSNTSIVSVSDDKTVRVWDTRSNECTSVLLGHTSTVNTVAIVGTEIVTGSEDGTVKIWN